MALTVSPPVANPIKIDPGVPYHYVVAAAGATGVTADSSSNFSVSISGLTLVVTFTGEIPSLATRYPLTIHVTDGATTVTQTLQFEIALDLIVLIQQRNYFQKVASTIDADGTDKLTVVNNGDWSPGDTQAIPFAINDYIIVPLGINATPDKLFVAGYVKSKNAADHSFKISDTPGGTTIAFEAGSYSAFPAMVSDASPHLWIGAANVKVGQAISLGLTCVTGQPLPANLGGTVYVKAIIDRWHIDVSSTVSGPAIQGTSNAYGFTPDCAYALLDRTSGRHYPDINSASSISVGVGAAVNYIIAHDIPCISLSAKGLPTGLVMVSSGIAGGFGLISGNAPSAPGTYAVVLNATHEKPAPPFAFAAPTYYTSSRYLLIVVGGGGDIVSPVQPGSGPGVGGGGGTPFNNLPESHSARILYDGDFGQARQVGQPIFDTPFGAADPREYVYRVTYWQLRSAHNDIALDTPGPYGGVYVGEVKGSIHDVGGGIIGFQREFALVPNARDEFETFNYAQQFVGTVNGNWVNNIGEIPLTVRSRVHYDYFLTRTPTTIPLGRAPRVGQIPWGNDSAIIPLNGWERLSYGEEILAVDAIARVWKGNIYERVQRFVAFGGGIREKH